VYIRLPYPGIVFIVKLPPAVPDYVLARLLKTLFEETAFALSRL